ncbi:hypothetical protein ACFFW8_21885 [Erwinia tracheiphila]|uniref:Uncharacterized protein n=1 Tax=Erwinia tracheiphila TaxID=65700 RepID=A0A345CPH8_9GAMM|nr:hypothetical protein AV903_03270 [Erwinia tracheiphila]
MKIFLFSLLGACCGFAVLLLAFPALSRLFVGPVVSDDEMNQNVLLFLVSAPLFSIAGALICGFYARHYLNKKRQL